MMIFIVFILAVTGACLIVTKSSLFKPTRIFISEQYCLKSNHFAETGKKRFMFIVLKFFESILNCPMCLSPYVGLLFTIIIYYSRSNIILTYILYPFAAVPVVTLIIQYYSKETRKP